MAGLSPQLSLSLDLIRFLAACAVVMCHFGARRISGGMLWQLNPYGAEAVDVFFVLSGYVIAYAATRETTATVFAVRRAARIYSVAVPAVVLTFLLDAVGRQWAPGLYGGMPAYAGGHAGPLAQAAGGLLFFNQAWFLALPVGSNVPWWSMGYEVAYYAAFGLAMFGRGWVRVVGPVVLALAAGPDIVLLAPLWVAGAAVFTWHRRGGPGRLGGAALVGGGLAVWAGYEIMAWRFGRPVGVVPLVRAELLQDWLVGAAFTAVLAGLPALLGREAAPWWLAGPVRLLAGRSFALYLMHYPILLCLHAALLRFAPGLSPVWQLPAMAAVVLVLAEVTERRKADWQDLFAKVSGV